jgi:hypothetical protein
MTITWSGCIKYFDLKSLMFRGWKRSKVLSFFTYCSYTKKLTRSKWKAKIRRKKLRSLHTIPEYYQALYSLAVFPWSPVMSSWSPVICSWSPIMSSRSPDVLVISCNVIVITCYVLVITCYVVVITFYVLVTVCHVLVIICHVHVITSHILMIICYDLVTNHSRENSS